MKALVLGGTGQMGRAVAARLLAEGWEVAVATGGGRPLPPGLEGARHVAQTTLAEMVGRGVDALFDPFCMTAADAARRAAVAGDVGQFVIVSTASVYADAAGNGFETGTFPDYRGPVAETNPTVAPGDGYSAGKAAMERACEGLRATLLRPGAIHGPGARHPREWVVVKRILDGRPAFPVQGDGANLFQTTAAGNIARATLACLKAGAIGPVNVGDPGPPRLRDIVGLIAAAMGRDLPLVPVAPDAADAHVGATPWSVPHDVILDCGRLDALGWKPATYAEALPPYLDWMLAAGAGDWRAAFPGFAHYPHDPFDYAAEDRALASRPAAR